MKKKCFVFLCLFCIGAFTQALWAQKKVTGVVMEKDAGLPLIGANVVIKGTTVGTVTDLDGMYSLEAGANDVLQFSFLGMRTEEEVVGNRTVINVDMFSDAQKINEVVVTAMGIERKSKSLTYATQQVGGNELTRAKDPNMMNALQGKTAGLVITPNSTGAGGSSNILLRGNKSAWGNNQALIVVDGIPMSNPQTVQLSAEYAGRDGGDALSNLNPDDIAGMNVLKGASAAALYGSMAANGVIMITTKKGREGATRVDFSSNTMLETILSAPKLQGTYGAVKAGDLLNKNSWGEKTGGNAAGKDRLNDFFRTGATFINSLTVNGGTEKVQSFLSYANTSSLGIMPTNDFYRHNISARESFNLFNNRLKVDASLAYITQTGANRPHGGTYFNPLTGLYTFPANGDFGHYKQNYEVFNAGRNLYAQNWYTGLDDFTANPYWVLNRMKTTEGRDRFIGSATANLKITDYLNIQGRLNVDDAKDKYEQKMYATTNEPWAPGNGRYTLENFASRQFYGDVMANFSKTFDAIWEVNASVGSSFIETKIVRTILDSDKLNLDQPNLFTPENIKGNGHNKTDNPRKRLNSVFGTAQLGFKGMVYIDITGRNDWSSALAFTNNMSYFYPSAGLTALLNEMFTMGDFVNLLKVRASYSIVGNDVPAFITHPMDVMNRGNLSPNTKAPFLEMKPEKMHSMEFGFDVTLNENRFNMDFTYYKTNNKNQYFEIASPLASGYESYYINAGDIRNSGFEASASYRFDLTELLSWKTDFNLSYNDNKIMKLDPRLGDGVELGSGSGLHFKLKEGGSYGDVFGRALVRDANGNVEVTGEGNPRLTDNDQNYLGNVNSKWQLGWGNNFTYKDLSLYFLFDGKIGGTTFNLTQSYLDAFGVTQVTADARDKGGVNIGNGKTMDAQRFYEVTAGKDKALSEYAYSATNFRLREVSLGYTFRNLLGVSKNLDVSLVGRNLFFVYKDAPNDPDVSISTHNAWHGVDLFGLPSTRSYGINLKATF
jgi:TonB-linked SusC/RagA family outer membrane protein